MDTSEKKSFRTSLPYFIVNQYLLQTNYITLGINQ